MEMLGKTEKNGFIRYLTYHRGINSWHIVAATRIFVRVHHERTVTIDVYYKNARFSIVEYLTAKHRQCLLGFRRANVIRLRKCRYQC